MAVSSKVCFMFPGQGSQKRGMGEGLFERFPEVTSAADAILGYSVRELCLQDAGQRLGQTQYTQPALYTVNALTYCQYLKTGGAKPDYVSGHSLGEYNALLAAEVFDFSTGLRLVQKRGALMAQAQGGGMAAVIGLSFDQVRAVLDQQGLPQLDLANINTPNQMVISGPRTEIQRAQAIFEATGAMMYLPLNVSGAFHSRYMAEFRRQFELFLSEFAFSGPRVPVISNVEARPYTADQVKRLLAEQMTHSVRWCDSVLYLRQQGVEEFREIGPGKVLTGLVSKIRL